MQARRIIENPEPISVGPGSEDKMVDGLELIMYGANGKIQADRAKTALGIEAKAPRFFGALERDVVAALTDRQREPEHLLKLMQME